MLASTVPLMYPYPRRYSHKAAIKIAAVQPKQVMPIQKFLVFFIGYCTSSSLQWFGGGAGIAGKSQRNMKIAGNKPTILPLLRLHRCKSVVCPSQATGTQDLGVGSTVGDQAGWCPRVCIGPCPVRVVKKQSPTKEQNSRSAGKYPLLEHSRLSSGKNQCDSISVISQLPQPIGTFLSVRRIQPDTAMPRFGHAITLGETPILFRYRPRMSCK